MLQRIQSLERMVRWLYCKVKNTAIGGIQSIIAGDNITVDNTDPLNPIVSSTGGGTNNNDTYITTLSYTLDDLGVATMEEVTDELVTTYINSLGLVKGANEIYEVEITENTELEYDMIHTLTFDESEIGNNLYIGLIRGSYTAFAGEVFVRSGISGVWQSVAISNVSIGTPTIINSSIIQVGHSFNIDGNNIMTPRFKASKVQTISIQNKTLPNIIGNSFMRTYAEGCKSLTSLSVPDTSNVTAVGDAFMLGYAYDCQSLISLNIPDTSNVTTVGSNFMVNYTLNCYLLTSLILPSVGWFATNNINWGILSSRLGILKGKVINPSDLAGWQLLTTSGKTLYTNQIQSSSDVEIL